MSERPDRPTPVRQPTHHDAARPRPSRAPPTTRGHPYRLVNLPVANAAAEGDKYDTTGLTLFSLDGKVKGSPSLGDHGANI